MLAIHVLKVTFLNPQTFVASIARSKVSVHTWHLKLNHLDAAVCRIPFTFQTQVDLIHMASVFLIDDSRSR